MPSPAQAGSLPVSGSSVGDDHRERRDAQRHRRHDHGRDGGVSPDQGPGQRYQHQALVGQQTASQARRLSAIKSLLTFGCKRFPQFFPVNVGAAFQLQQSKDALARRILPEETILDLLNVQRRATEDPYRERNAVLLRLLYKAALRRE